MCVCVCVTCLPSSLLSEMRPQQASHAFNILDARGAIGVTERARYFAKMRNLARDIAKLWLSRREELDFPLSRPSPKRTESSQRQTEGSSLPGKSLL